MIPSQPATQASAFDRRAFLQPSSTGPVAGGKRCGLRFSLLLPKPTGWGEKRSYPWLRELR